MSKKKHKKTIITPIKTYQIKYTVRDYIAHVLSGSKYFRMCRLTGGACQDKRKYDTNDTDIRLKSKKHNTLTLSVYIDNNDNTTINKLNKEQLYSKFYGYLMSKGLKPVKNSDYGSIIVLYPIIGNKDKTVYINNIIACSREECEFIYNYINIPIRKLNFILSSIYNIKQENIIDFYKDNIEENIVFNVFTCKYRLELQYNRLVLKENGNIIWSTYNWKLANDLMYMNNIYY